MDSTFSQYIHFFSRPNVQDLIGDLHTLRAEIPGRFALSTSFSFEDQVLTHILCTENVEAELFTLDTGRLFKETYSTWEGTLNRYKRPIKTYTPDQPKLNNYISEHGPNAFYTSVEKRKECCQIRKVIPLKEALNDVNVWITGIRAEHSGNRKNMSAVEWDESHKVLKIQPLLFWTSDQVRDFIKLNNIPYNPLHDRGFVSIGCAPCTRAIQVGEDFRAGRWWWEDADKKECGLHVNNSAK